MPSIETNISVVPLYEISARIFYSCGLEVCIQNSENHASEAKRVLYEI